MAALGATVPDPRDGAEMAPPAPTTTVGPVGAIAAAWARTRHDPFGVLLPAAGALWLQTAVVLAWWRLELPIDRWLLVGAGLLWGVELGAAPLRAAILAAGARAVGRPGPGWRRGLSLLGVVVLVGAVQGAALVGVLIVWGIGASLLLSYGLVSAAALWGAAGLVGGVGVAFALRVRFAFAPILAVDGGLAAWRALGPPADVRWGRTAAVVLSADVLFALGTLLAGAGALPGYPLRDLALQRLWEDLR